ncbi:hypothetical protein FJZ36_09410 [Candidatus Poribacteria bacterium]|nr:hypothetical protein [Candidatus Poribacteria bacterium]
MAEEGVSRFMRDRVEVVDQPALDTAKTLRERIEELTKKIEDGALSPSDANEQLDRLQRQLGWIEAVINERKKVVKLCETVELTREQTFHLNASELSVLIGGAGGGGSIVEVLGWDEPHVRAIVEVRSFDHDRDVAQHRAEKVSVNVTSDIGEALRDFGYRDTRDLTTFREMLRFRHADASKWVNDLTASPPFLYVSVPDQDWVTSKYEVPGTNAARRWTGPAVDIEKVAIHVPRAMRLRIASSGAVVRGMRAGVDLIAYDNGATLQDIEGEVRIVTRVATGCESNGSPEHEFYIRRHTKTDPSVRLNRIRGAILVRADASDVHIEDAIGSMDIATVMSQIQARLNHDCFAERLPLRFSSEWGDVELSVPAGFSAEHRLETEYGEIRTEAGKSTETWTAIGDDQALYVGSAGRHRTQDAPLQVWTRGGKIRLQTST